MLQVISVLSRCYICFTYMLQTYVPHVSSVFYKYVAFKCFMLFGESGDMRSDSGMARQPGNVGNL
jgi:hypothetical protein